MKNCINCSSAFEIHPRDHDFYARMGVAEPTHCPKCREQRRWATRNHSKLYHRKSDMTGKEMISLYSPDKPYKVYEEEEWWSDHWDPLDYGRDYDFKRPFFEQFHDLQLEVPRRGMHQDGSNENCDYITFGMSNKNGYLLYSCFYCEDCLYNTFGGFCKDCVDCTLCLKSELCYESVNCVSCYNVSYALNATSCRDSMLLDDCRNCSNCIACKNLRNKEYHIYNKPVSKEEFEAFKEKLLQGGLKEEQSRFNDWKVRLPHLNLRLDNTEDSTGEYLEGAKNCHDCYDIVWGAEDCNYIQIAGWQGKDMYDCCMTGKESDLLYEMVSTVTSHHCAFTTFCRTGSEVYYSDCVSECQNIFGCIGLKHKQYCILNKQYSKEEYETLLPRIIEHMQSTGEWGEFFPIKYSPFAYNETNAQDYYPLTKQEALAKGYQWKEDTVNERHGTELLICEECNKPYRVIAQEQKFLTGRTLPTPTKCPYCRHLVRLRQRNPNQLWERECGQCGQTMKTSYAPDRPELVVCEKCYLVAVY